MKHQLELKHSILARGFYPAEKTGVFTSNGSM